jgi:hypothetical protein
MDNWEENIIKWFTDIQKNLESLYQNIDEDINQAINFVNQEIDQWLGECEEYIDEMTIELNDLMEETENFFQELIDMLWENDSTEEIDEHNDNVNAPNEDWDNWFTNETYSLKPDPEKHPACVGCNHYHGYTYGGNMLVCAMHPYGWENKNCPDWEAKN